MHNQYQGEVLAELVRNGMIESVHSGHFLALNADGSIHKSKGNIDLPIFPRSSVKLFQAAAMVRNGLKVTPQQLALVQSSHSGAKMHQDAILNLLTEFRFTESDLRNSTDKPLGALERELWGSHPATHLAMNCSGKHAGMLATCALNHWDTKNYLSLDHPLQQAVLKEIEMATGEEVVNKTFDGCGAPLFSVTVRGLARALHMASVSADPVYQEVMAAARQYPEYVGGEGRLNTRMMQAIPGLFMKDGMEAVLVASLEDGRTLVIKIADGSLRAVGTIIQAAFAEWGITTPDEKMNVYGGSEIVGGMRATL
jgi:L-asparaginase II